MNERQTLDYDHAMLIAAEMLKRAIDRTTCDLLGQISGNDDYSLQNRMEIIKTVPELYNDVIERIDWNISWYGKKIIEKEEKNKE